MVTEALEKLIFQGRAQWKNFCCGVGGVLQMPVKENTFVVITNFTFSPFFDPPIGVIDAPGVEDKVAHSVKFFPRGGGKEYLYLFRTGYVPNNIAGTLHPSPIQNEHSQNCYMIFDKDVFIDIWNFQNPVHWVSTNFNTYTEKAQEPNPPLGYGTTVAATKEVLFGIGQYLPALTNRTEIAPAVGLDTYREQLQNDVVDKTKLEEIETGGDTNAIYHFPILNISYIEINEARESFVL